MHWQWLSSGGDRLRQQEKLLDFSFERISESCYALAGTARRNVIVGAQAKILKCRVGRALGGRVERNYADLRKICADAAKRFETMRCRRSQVEGNDIGL